ncbi:S8 family serine peptidase [Goodfellowiella coeruleoviolacea]|uniref:Serine protease, subtilisin family n=1 Tax=Goodfellowiella coeruleoviolacea TaxID=334858 RepID=A0AAE3KHD9_9PSEU|nr:S8 family serine peptidase [Goodfellowiella coeruleoviolacea]MCP2166354.1 Serine protease, subtilisin family [Goodfellowiella coeruleoviolacea]
MRGRRRRPAVAGAVVVAVAAAVVPGAGASAAPAERVVSASAQAGRSVTLITGDRVVVGGPEGISARPATGREHVRFLRQAGPDGTLVIPEDAATLVANGSLDRRLFNVTRLVEVGYDDTSRPDLPLIVGHADGQARSAALGAAAQVTRELASIGATAVRADKARAAEFWAGVRGTGATATTMAAGVTRIWLDGPVRATLDHSVPQIGAPQAWQAGHTGRGATVAVLDTGIDTSHPDLADAVIRAQDFTGSESGTDDRVGHGTHVASTITGGGTASGGRYRGVAPDTALVNGKVLDDGGGGAESWIIAGMEWAAASGADVVNMSLGGGLPEDGTDPMSQALNRISEQTGALFVVSAGNSGGAPGSPAAADRALTVGAVDRNDALAEFSSRGPRWVDRAIKPDLTAPGVDIVAARAAHGQLGDPVDQSYTRLSGTSMAAPHVAGAAAILAGQHPDWTAEQLKAALMGAAKPIGGQSVFEQGAGRVDVARAVAQPVYATPASLSNGVARWPHGDDAPIVRTLTYHNAGAQPLTLELAADVRDPAGNPAPAGMVTVAPSRVTVPAGGQAEVTVTTTTTVDGPDGDYTGRITATGGQVSIPTPIAVTREVESYDVTLHFLDRAGKATPEYSFRFVDVDHPQAYLSYDASGTVVARLPKGRFYFEAGVQDQVADGWEYTNVIEPEFTVTGDAEVTVDARAGKPVGVTVDRANARPGSSYLSYGLRTSWGDTGLSIIGRDFAGQYTRPSSTSAPGRFTFEIGAVLAEPDGRGGFAGSPYLYHVRQSEDALVPADLVRHSADRDLVRVRSEHAATVPGRHGVREEMVSAPLPFGLTEYYSPNVPWYSTFSETTDPDDFDARESYLSTVPARTFSAGRPVLERWNTGVFGPAFPLEPGYPADLAGREGDTLGFNVPLFTDQAADHGGGARTTSGGTVLYRDGERVGETAYAGYGRFPVPAGRASFRLHTEATRGGAGQLSTSVRADWTFASDTVAGAEPAALPLTAVRFAPVLDEHNRAPSGVPFPVPLYLQRNGQDKPGEVRELAVWASFDDGATWTAVPVRTVAGQRLAFPHHPRGAGYVSLRASATDAEGNAVEQTIIRAYALK